MADLIERGEAIRRLCAECSNMGSFACISCKIPSAIKSAPPANRWIPCKERLPEQDCAVLVCCYGSDLILTQNGETIPEAVKRTRRQIVRVTVGFLCSDGWYGADLFPMMVFPTYWMPLPEPPESEVQNG